MKVFPLGIPLRRLINEPTISPVIPPKVMTPPEIAPKTIASSNKVDKLKRTVRVMAKKDPLIHIAIGKEDQEITDVAENFSTVYNQLIHSLPLEDQNIKSAFIKLTMSKPLKIK